MGVLRLICMLPHRAALASGRLLGRFAHAMGGSRRAIVRRNIELCFPELSTVERNTLAHQHFLALGMSVIEMGLGRWSTLQHLQSITNLTGIEHLQRAVDAGKGVILLSAHFTTLEISGQSTGAKCQPAVRRGLSQEQKRVHNGAAAQRSRASLRTTTIEKRDIKMMVRSLRSGRPVWYAPDQSYNRKGSEVIDFFGVPSMHTTATSTLARLGKAVVIPFFPRRRKDGHYDMVLAPALENFPGDDPIEDTRRYIDVLETHIRTCPEQYFWIHRKFKDLPDSLPDFYADLDALK